MSFLVLMVTLLLSLFGFISPSDPTPTPTPTPTQDPVSYQQRDISVGDLKLSIPFPSQAAEPATSASAAPARASVDRGALQVTVNRAKVIRLPERAQTVIIGNPAIADLSLQKNGIVVVDTRAGKRWPVWAELDMNADPPNRALIVRTAVNFREGHRYVIGVRGLGSAGGAFVARILVGMVFLAQRLVGRTNDFLRRVARHLQIVIMCVDFGHKVGA